MKQRTAAALTIEQLVWEKGGWVTMTPCFSGANGVTPILGPGKVMQPLKREFFGLYISSQVMVQSVLQNKDSM